MPSALSRAIDLAIELQRHVGFVSRITLLARLDQRLIADRRPADRWVVVTGGPRMRKSIVLAAWPACREAADDVVTHHFIQRGWVNWDDPAALAGSPVAQIEAGFPEQREPEAHAQVASAARLNACLVTPDGRHVVSASEDQTLKVWDLATYTCRIVRRMMPPTTPSRRLNHGYCQRHIGSVWVPRVVWSNPSQHVTHDGGSEKRRDEHPLASIPPARPFHTGTL